MPVLERIANFLKGQQPLQQEYATLGINLKGRSPKDVSHAELDAARRTQLKELHAVRRAMPDEVMQAAVDDKLRQVNEAHTRIKNPDRIPGKAGVSGPIPMSEVKDSVSHATESGNNKIDIVFNQREKSVFGSWRPTEGKRLLLADLRETSVLEKAAKAGAKGKGGLGVAAATIAAVGGLGVAEYNATLTSEARKNWQNRVALNYAPQGQAL